MNLIPQQEVMGVQVAVLSLDEVKHLVDAVIAQPMAEPFVFQYANAHTLNMAWEDVHFKRLLSGANVVWCDGFSILWGMALIGKSLGERFTWIDILEHCGAHWGRQNYRVFWLGAMPNVAQSAAERTNARFTGLLSAGAHHGYFSADENAALIDQINQSGAQLLFVGMGSPKQEQWIAEHRQALRVPVIFTVGAGLDYVAGYKRRAPKFLTHNGLEWLTRLIAEPRRMWQRYLVELPLFLFRMVRHQQRR